MIWILAWIVFLIDAAFGKKNQTTAKTDVTYKNSTVHSAIIVETTEYSNQTLQAIQNQSTDIISDDFTITETLSATIQFDSGVIYRAIVVCLFCSLIFFCSCCIKRRCRKKQLRRYDLLENQNGLIMNGDSDSDEIDIFDKANASKKGQK